MKKKCLALITIVLLLVTPIMAMAAETNNSSSSAFKSYTFDYYGKTVHCPAPYTLEQRVTGKDLGIPDFEIANDIFVTPKGTVFVAVSGQDETSNAVYQLDENLKLEKSWLGYTDDKGEFVKFQKPTGVFVTPKDEVYIADSGSKNIIQLNTDFTQVRIIPPPKVEDSAILSENIGFIEKYTPGHLVVNDAGRIHVVAQNVNEGIVVFDPDGKFNGFMAAGKVHASAMDIFWRKFSNEAMLKRMNAFVPVEYSNIMIDDRGFIYATSASKDVDTVIGEIKSGKGTEESSLVRRLNTNGTDILRRKGYVPVVGDADILDLQLVKGDDQSGISRIVDIACGPNGSFTLLDSKRNHMFTYNSEGYLLYAFSGPDVSVGGTDTPVSIAQYNDKIFLLDTATSSISLYEKTEFAKLLDQAAYCEDNGEYTKAAEYWEKVLDANANYDLAYNGLGKKAYSDKDYKAAMFYYKNSNNRDGYSKAYKQYRNQVSAKYIIPIAVIVIVIATLVAAIFAVFKYMRKRREKRGGSRE
ncbi:MAG: hypothetical protein RR497_01030 [Oscillospiraceae bacterium]